MSNQKVIPNYANIQIPRTQATQKKIHTIWIKKIVNTDDIIVL